MNTPTAEDIAARAYQIWEEQGRPVDDGRSLERWLTAERELRRSDSAEADSALPLPLHESPTVTNLDRALPPAERTRLRSERHGRIQITAPPAERSPHFVIAADRAHVRFHHETPPDGPGGTARWELVNAIDLPAGKQRYTGRDTDQAGRFPGSRGVSPGGSIDERLPMLEEHQRRIAAEVAAQIEDFLQNYPDATWDFAAGPEVHYAILESLPPATSQRLRRTLTKDLVNQPGELRRQFQATSPRP
jgi:hypothetical protein